MSAGNLLHRPGGEWWESVQAHFAEERRKAELARLEDAGEAMRIALDRSPDSP